MRCRNLNSANWGAMVPLKLSFARLLKSMTAKKIYINVGILHLWDPKPQQCKNNLSSLESEVLIDDVSKWATTRTAKCTLQLRGCGFNCFQLYKETWFTEIKVLWPRDVHGFDVIGGVEANNAPPVARSYICVIPALQSFFRILDRLLEGLQCQPCFPPSLLSFQKT